MYAFSRVRYLMDAIFFQEYLRKRAALTRNSFSVQKVLEAGNVVGAVVGLVAAPGVIDGLVAAPGVVVGALGVARGVVPLTATAFVAAFIPSIGFIPMVEVPAIGFMLIVDVPAIAVIPDGATITLFPSPRAAEEIFSIGRVAPTTICIFLFR